MNGIKKTTKPSIIIIAVVTTVAVILSAAMVLGIQSQTFHTVLEQSAKSNATTPATNTVVTVTQANQLTRPSG